MDDYAFYLQALLDLYEATFKVKYLKKALFLGNEIIRLFGDDSQGGFFLTGWDAEELLVRSKEIYDGAYPSGNSTLALNFIRLYHLTLNNQWLVKTSESFKTFAVSIDQHPSSYAQMLSAFDYSLGPSQEIVIAAPVHDAAVTGMLEELNQKFLPLAVTILNIEKSAQSKELLHLLPWLKEQTALEGKPAVYICQDHVCQLPIRDGDKFKEILEGLR